MAKFAADDMIDGALNIIKNNVILMTACSAQPTTYAEATATYALADVVMASGDFTVGNGDTNGRKVAVAAKNSVTVDTGGTITHLALVDGTRLLYVTTTGSKVVDALDQVNIPTWDIEIADPT